jgi:hypothetical protein
MFSNAEQMSTISFVTIHLMDRVEVPVLGSDCSTRGATILPAHCRADRHVVVLNFLGFNPIDAGPRLVGDCSGIFHAATPTTAHAHDEQSQDYGRQGEFSVDECARLDHNGGCILGERWADCDVVSLSR